MGLSDVGENAALKLIFQNIAWANVGDASGLQPSSGVGNIHVSLHTGDPGEAGDQTTNEADYTDYARQAVVRSAAGWTVTTNNVSNAAAVTFPEAGVGDTDTVTYFGLGYAVSGAGSLYASAILDNSREISTGITPNFAIGELDTDAD